MSMELEPLKTEKEVPSPSRSEQHMEREKWGRKVEFLLSVCGFAVGPGNLWRFPYICMRNGGGAFLIPFIILLFTLGLPLFFVEVSLGQFSGRGIYGVWNICPIFKGIGIGMGIADIVVTAYFATILPWTMYYFGNSFINPIPWSLCHQTWNTEHCQTERHVDKVLKYLNTTLNATDTNPRANSTHNTTSLQGNVGRKLPFISSEEEFLQFNVLNISDGIHNFGKLQLHLVLCFLASWLIIYFCLARGIKSLGKVVYVTATLPYILLLVLLIRGITLPGALDGILFYIKPDFQRILSSQVWIEAAIQIFYSSGIIWGPLITFASFNKFDNNCLRDSIILICVGEGTSIFGGFVVFSILGYMAHKVNVPIETVVKSGPGLGYIAYPEAVMELPLPNLWSVLFFLMLFTLTLDGVFACMEPTCTAFVDNFPFLRKRRAAFIAAVIGCMVLLGLPLCAQNGMYIYQLADWYTASFALPLFGLLECIIVAWIYGAARFSKDVELMLGNGIPVVIRLTLCFITPAILLVILLFIIAKYSPPSYGEYEYPVAAVVFGWLIALCPIVPLPIVAIREIKKAPGTTMIQKIGNAFKPNDKWKPMDKKLAAEYRLVTQSDSWCDTIKTNILG